jgi:hypothetical protein
MRTKKGERTGDKKISIKNTSSPRPWLGGLRHKKERTIEKANKVDKCHEKKYMEQVYLFFLSLYPIKFGYSLGGYSHQERWARTQWYLFMHTGAKKAKEDLGSIITPIGREVFYWFRLNNPNILYTRTVKQGCDIWFSGCVIATKLECRR